MKILLLCPRERERKNVVSVLPGMSLSTTEVIYDMRLLLTIYYK
jgi:hypothetical protein